MNVYLLELSRIVLEFNNNIHASIGMCCVEIEVGIHIAALCMSENVCMYTHLVVCAYIYFCTYF
jgi:hypothetical protein